NVDATGYVSGKGVYEAPGIRVYSAVNKPSPSEIGALPASGTAVAANKLATARTIAGVPFDGTVNISIHPGNVGAYSKVEVDSRVNAKGNKNIANISANGWWKCGDTGVVYQWGITRVLEPLEIITVQLPVRFSNVCVNVILTVNRLGASGGIANGYAAVLSPSSFKLTNDYANTGISVGYYWFAVGY
ncbi:gp53-like domain-containing protein, partial [Photorhabdus luminescens]|uniref:gp53-like domain-containing protein n=1 Tax=Photorhabdus luminescens TaxID=29488 RepID=UPI003D2BF51A|nr:hypothetical protein [Photorhabdus luminescens subsp. venezuelensis]